MEQFAERRVGLGLAIGIFILPFVFVWTLLRSGHTTFARVLGFGWLGLFLIVAVSDDNVGRSHGNVKSNPSTPKQQNEARSGAEESVTERVGRSNWRYDTQTDEMRGSVSRFARLTSENELDFDFPYGGGNSTNLVIQDRPDDGTSVYLEIESGQFLCNSFTNTKVSVKFDDGPIQKFECSDTSDGTTNVIFIRSENRFISALKKSKQVMIEAEFFQEGRRQIKFNVAGLDWK